MVHLVEEAIAGLVDRRAAETAVWAAFVAWGRGEAQPSRRVRAAASGGMASAMVAVVPPYCGGKIYATAAGRFTFVIVLFDLDGRLLATLDGDTITRLRTPAVSSLAIRHLARRAATTAAVIGTGRQAWLHLEMLRDALPELEELRVCGRSDRAEVLAERARVLGLEAVAHHDATAAVDGAHVIVTVTSATTPLFPAHAVGEDALICAVGATKHDRAEIAPELVARCVTVVCDDVEGSRTECGDLIQAAAASCFEWSRAVELHDLAAGVTTVRRAGNGPVLFETQGVPIQDLAVAALAYERSIS
jgi:ornithine cyclodeaminase